MDNKVNKLFDLYTFAELAYKNKHEDKKEEELYPEDWSASDNYEKKIDILVEAIQNDVLIEDTELYFKSKYFG